MIIFKANNSEYSYPSSLTDITFDKYLTWLEKYESKEPELLKELKKSYADEAELLAKKEDAPVEQIEEIRIARQEIMQSITKWEYANRFLPHFARAVSFFTQMPYSLIMGIGDYDGNPMNVSHLETLYWEIMKALEATEADFTYKNCFEFEGEFYFLPENEMKGSTVIDFMEAAQLEVNANELANGNWMAMLEIASVLLRKKTADGTLEKYHENSVYRRNKNNFGRLPMNVVVNVAFFLLRQNDTSAKNFQISTAARHLARLKQGSENLRNPLVGI